MKKEYLIIGSNNFWYSSCLKSMKEVSTEIKQIKNHYEDGNYGDPEGSYCPEPPEKLHIYKAEEIKQIEL